jgi:hypothetical protein
MISCLFPSIRPPKEEIFEFRGELPEPAEAILLGHVQKLNCFQTDLGELAYKQDANFHLSAPTGVGKTGPGSSRSSATRRSLAPEGRLRRADEGPHPLLAQSFAAFRTRLLRTLS